MGSILEEYMKQFEADKQNENHEVVSNNDDELVKQFASDFSKDEYAKKLDELRNDPNDMANKFHREYPTISDKQMDEQGLLSSEKIDAYLIVILTHDKLLQNMNVVVVLRLIFNMLIQDSYMLTRIINK